MTPPAVAGPRGACGLPPRRQLVRSASHLGLGQVAGTLLGLLGVLGLTRLIGPREYGLYVTAQGVLGLVQLLARWEIPTYLVRRPGVLPRRTADVAFTLLLGFSLAGIGLGLAVLGPLGAWLGESGFAPLAVVLFFGLPLRLACAVPLAILERSLRFRTVVAAELGAQGVQVTVALGLAWAGAGAWAAVIGCLIQQGVLAVALFRGAAYRPRLAWERRRARVMVRYGAALTLSLGVWQLRGLANPLLVGRVLGPEAVGAVALAMRLVEALSVAKRVAWRLALPVLVRVQGDAARVGAVLREGALLQVLGTGVPLVAMAWLGPVLLPPLLGAGWGQALDVFPFLAAGQVCNAQFSLHSALLFVRGRIAPVTTFHAIHVCLLGVGVLVGVASFGVLGYGVGEVLALASYPILHRTLVREFGKPHQGASLVLAGCLVLALFGRVLGAVALVPAVLGLVVVLVQTRWLRAPLVAR